MRGIAILGAVLVAALGQSAGSTWLQAPHANYTIYYQPGYEADRDFSATWLDHAEALMRSKYAVSETGYQVGFYLYVIPNDHADVGHAQIERSGSARTAVIHYLAPAA